MHVKYSQHKITYIQTSFWLKGQTKKTLCKNINMKKNPVFVLLGKYTEKLSHIQDKQIFCYFFLLV